VDLRTRFTGTPCSEICFEFHFIVARPITGSSVSTRSLGKGNVFPVSIIEGGWNGVGFESIVLALGGPVEKKFQFGARAMARPTHKSRSTAEFFALTSLGRTLHAMRPCIGVLREAYSKWERRAPLTPAHVARIAADGIRVLVQPSAKRVFSDAEYAAAGATIAEDLSPAATILGVKQPPLGALLPDHTHMFFSHTIKGQPENMPLLDEALTKRVRLIDYECVRRSGHESAVRTIAFGELAGKVGIISGLRGLGLRLLSLGHSNALLGVGPPHTYHSYDVDACHALAATGRQIREHGLPACYAPMVIAIAGTGNVSRGAVHALNSLNGEGTGAKVMEWVSPRELAALTVLVGQSGEHQHKIYGVVLGVEDVVQRNDGGAFSKEEYYEHPERFSSTFHSAIAPHISMLVTAMYWDRRFPRLLSAEQLRALGPDGSRRLLAVADLTCDVDGAVEALTRTSTIDEPFYMHDVLFGREAGVGTDGPGLLLLGVDILPAELPREASAHFGDCLLPFVGPLAHCHGAADPLPPELEAATITLGGRLTPQFEYIDGLRRLAQRHDASEAAQEGGGAPEELALQGSTVLCLRGHLFDSGLINSALDTVEAAKGRFDLLDVQVRPNSARVEDRRHLSSALLQVTLDGGRPALDALIAQLRRLAKETRGADAAVDEMPSAYCGGVYERTLHTHHVAGSTLPPLLSGFAPPEPAAEDAATPVRLHGPPRRVLVLGAGLVAAPAVEFLSRGSADSVTVVSALEYEAQTLVAALGRPNVNAATLSARPEAEGDWAEITAYIEWADAVLSLLPAHMHEPVARACIGAGVPLVTASYVSPQMASLDAMATEFGVSILCEMGLDPGIDHMSARSMIDAAHADGGVVTAFRSVCGGLPAPEAAGDNPFGYKFSWSPKGVLAATDNGARYLRDGQVVEVSAGRLLRAAVPLEGSQLSKTMRLEVLPNRDSLAYRGRYDLDSPHLRSLFRGTLRYEGWSSLFDELARLGLTDDSGRVPKGVETWLQLLAHVGASGGAGAGPAALSALEWLGVFDPATPVVVPPRGGSVRDATCALLEARLAYGPTERDAILMEHQMRVEYPDDVGERRPPCVVTSTLVEYGTPGGDSAMARSVGLTAAIGVSLVLSANQTLANGLPCNLLPVGVLRPTLPVVYEYALPLLAEEGLHFNETHQSDEAGRAGAEQW